MSNLIVESGGKTLVLAPDVWILDHTLFLVDVEGFVPLDESHCPTEDVFLGWDWLVLFLFFGHCFATFTTDERL